MSAPKILIVDDSPADVNLLQLALLEHGEPFELEVVVDGRQALDLVRIYSQSEVSQPCVVVLDLNLPKHNGLEVLRAIRAEPAMRHIGVLVLTGGARPKEAEELQRLGAYYRSKPTQLSELSELAAEVMEICKGLTVSA